MPVPARERDLVRSLAARVAEIAAHPGQQERRELWLSLNRLERVRPTVHIQALDANIWEDLIPPDTLQCSDPFCRAHELEMRKRIYCWERFQDDRVTEDVFVCPLAIEGLGVGPSVEVDRPEKRWGAHSYKSVIAEEKDLEKIQVEQEVRVNQDATDQHYQALCELYDGVLRVEKRGPDFFWFAPMDNFATWRGIQQMFTDLLDRPAWVHEAMDRITRAHLNRLEQLEALGVLSPGHRNAHLGSGGYGWTEALGAAGDTATGRVGERESGGVGEWESGGAGDAAGCGSGTGSPVRLKGLWARAATQLFTEGISPEMHWEFAIQYEKRLLERFGLSCYGCCEPLDRKMEMVRRIGNLRRVSMSPWVDLERAAAAVGRDYVYTHKPNPSIVSMEQWHPDLAEQQLREAFEKTRDNVMEVNLQDLHTVRGEPHRLDEWSRIARQLAEEYA